jgi:hypothetical protein
MKPTALDILRSVAECAYAFFFVAALILYALFSNEPFIDDPYL